MISANIDSTDPPIDSTTQISLGTLNSLKIVYDVKVSLSEKNISIYQVNEADATKPTLRQTAPGDNSEFCTIIDGTTISLKVLPSTFNSQNSTYFVSTESDFVRSQNKKEPILGLKPFIWNLHTGIFLFVI